MLKQFIKLTWQDIEKNVSVLQDKLPQWLTAPIEEYICISVARGGLIPMGLLAYSMNIRRIETICAHSYEDMSQGSLNLENTLSKATCLHKNIIIIDDLSDTGKTFSGLKKNLPHALYACLYAKPLGAAQTDVYATLMPQDSWLVFPWDSSK